MSAPDLTAFDKAVWKARNEMVRWGDACCMSCLAADFKIDDLIAAAEARGYARAQLEAQP